MGSNMITNFDILTIVPQLLILFLIVVVMVIDVVRKTTAKGNTVGWITFFNAAGQAKIPGPSALAGSKIVQSPVQGDPSEFKAVRIDEFAAGSFGDKGHGPVGINLEQPDDLKGKVTVMTIITGVKSPWILGKNDQAQRSYERSSMMSDELGIEIVR